MSSPLILSLSTVFALIGIVLVAIAFGTNNWQEYKVDRAILKSLAQSDPALREVDSSDLFYSRSYGLFLECFSSEIPPAEKLKTKNTQLSPLGATCLKVNDYQIPEDKDVTATYDSNQKTRMHLMRTMVAFYIVGLMFLLCCLFTGIGGCWCRSAGLILSTGVLLLFATLFFAGSMAIWHGVDYLTREVLATEGSYQKWPRALKENTKIDYGWSYMISWIGIGFVLVSSVLMLAAYRSMKEEEREEYEKKRGPFMVANPYDKQALMPYAYSGYGQYGGGYPQAQYGAYGSYPTSGYAPYGYMTYGR